MIAWRIEAPKKILLDDLCISQKRAKILRELKYEEAAIIKNRTQGCSAVLNLFQHWPIINAAKVLPNPL